MIISVEDEVNKQFRKNYSSNSITTGKNYLAFEIAKQFVLNFLNFEISELKIGSDIKIIGLDVPIEINHYVKELDLEIKLKGKIDRIDEHNGDLRIMDYKTGRADEKHRIQIQAYQEAIQAMGYVVQASIIVYISENLITPEFI